jgi:hypothetical protein
VSKVSLGIASYLTDDIVGLSNFYAEVFDLDEVMDLRSDIFRGLDCDGVTIGFSALAAYEMLGIEDWANPTGTAQYLTFETATKAEVDTRTAAALERGAALLHEAYETYYNTYQSVLSDPVGHVFRINHFL